MLGLLVRVLKVAAKVGRRGVVLQPPPWALPLQHQAAQLLVLELVAHHGQQRPADLVAVALFGGADERGRVCPWPEPFDRGQQ
jgi:hypothetical protein